MNLTTLVLIYIIGVLLFLIFGVMAIQHSDAADGFVSLLEQRFAMLPGQTRVVPECGCTIRYMGTSVNGRHYAVRIDRLD